MKKLLLSIIVITVITAKMNSALAVPLTGNYTINSAVATGGTNFISFTSFADSINLNGVSGNVVVTVTPGSGPYHEQVVLRDFPGSSATSTVTLNGSGEFIRGTTDSTNRHTIRLWDVKYFTIENLRIVRDSLSTHAYYGIHIYNTGDHITINNCEVDMSGTTSTLNGAFVASGSTSSILVAGDFHDINITHNTTMGGGYGASVFGLSAAVHATNIVISDNTFYDFNSNGIYLRETDGTIVSRNSFDKRTSNCTSVNAIQVAQAANINANIFSNFIKLTQTSNCSQTFRGIYLFNGTGHKVYNNVIYDVNLVSGNFSAIVVRTGGTAPEIYFNTISIDNPLPGTGDLFGIEEDLSNTNSILRNNLISISQPTTGVKAALAIGAVATVSTALNSDYNLLWVPGGNIAVKNTLTPALYPTMTDWQVASTQDANSRNSDPFLTAPTIPIPTNVAIDNAGITLPLVSTDVLGNVRSTPPDIGAYEFIADGIGKIQTQNLFVYPNPVTSVLNFNLPESSGNQSSILIFNAEGKLVIEKKILCSGVQMTVPVEELVPGAYFSIITVGEKNYHLRFLKQ